MEGYFRFARWIVFAASLAFMSGCVTQQTAWPSGRAAQGARADDQEGNAVVAHLRTRYNDTSRACADRPALPLFLCSGIMLRGTEFSSNFHSWRPNPNSPKGDGVSFSWLRQDARFIKLAYGYRLGFITYPMIYNPAPVIDLEVLCGFPIDSDTNLRTNDGCGSHRNYPTVSGPCVAQQITTASQWLQHYNALATGNRQEHQCGFALVTGTPNSASLFLTIIDAMKGLGTVSLAEQNELVIRSWKDTPDQIGIEAFFYLDATGLAGAKGMQADFSKTVGVWRPVIQMVLPTATAPAEFYYRPSDQTGR